MDDDLNGLLRCFAFLSLLFATFCRATANVNQICTLLTSTFALEDLGASGLLVAAVQPRAFLVVLHGFPMFSTSCNGGSVPTT
jgi:hypothetical protein